MKAISYKGYNAAVELDPDDEIFVGHLQGVNDVVGFHAETVDALRDAFHLAVDDYVQTCAAVGKLAEKPYVRF